MIPNSKKLKRTICLLMDIKDKSPNNKSKSNKFLLHNKKIQLMKNLNSINISIIILNPNQTAVILTNMKNK